MQFTYKEGKDWKRILFKNLPFSSVCYCGGWWRHIKILLLRKDVVCIMVINFTRMLQGIVFKISLCLLQHTERHKKYYIFQFKNNQKSPKYTKSLLCDDHQGMMNKMKQARKRRKAAITKHSGTRMWDFHMTKTCLLLSTE